MSYVTLNIKKGSTAKPGLFETNTYETKITNSACASAATPVNAYAANLEHIQTTSTTGHLSYPFQPFGKEYKLCLVDTSNRLIKASYENTTVKGSELTVYPEELDQGWVRIQRSHRTNHVGKRRKNQRQTHKSGTHHQRSNLENRKG